MPDFLFEDIVDKKNGFLRGPFGGDLKKEIFVPKSKYTYKVYEQGVVLNRDSSIGRYYISKDYFDKKMHRFEVSTKDFLVSCSGVNYGAIYQLDQNIEPGVINQALLRIKLDNKKIYDNYFLYLFRLHIVNMIVGRKGDSTIPNFPPLTVIKKLKLSLPSLNIQEKVGGLLRSLDDKIELNNHINTELETMAKTLYDYWFVQFDFPDANGKPYKTAGGKMAYNATLNRDIPESWEVKHLDNHLTCNAKKLGKKHNLAEIEYLDTANLTKNVIYTLQHLEFREDNVPSRANMIVSKNDILYSTVRPNQYHYGLIRYPVDNMVASTGFSVLSHKTNTEYNAIFYLHLTNDATSDRLIRISESSKSSYPSISPSDILNINIALPNTDELLNKASTFLNPMFDKIAIAQSENKELESLRDWLLPMLMNGQVTVK